MKLILRFDMEKTGEINFLDIISQFFDRIFLNFLIFFKVMKGIKLVNT